MKNPLQQLAPEVRLVVYVLLGVLALFYSAWQMADGDWGKAVGLFLGSLGFATAGSNVQVKRRRRRRRRRGFGGDPDHVGAIR